MSLLDEPEDWLARLHEERPNGLVFVSVVGHGKSAVVFEAKASDGVTVAVKLYDNRRLSRFGLDVQMERIQRELGLRQHDCASLVQVIDGGTLSCRGETFSFVTLEFVDGEDLRKYVSAGRLQDGVIRSHLDSLFLAADFLDKKGIHHRDIKVDNCRVRPSGKLVLLDLGVLRLVGTSDLTDGPDDPKTKYFLGTLRYAPPELLRRKEQNTIEAWRAITVYQIGGVLYELIHGVPLFSHIREPYAELVDAVSNTRPVVMRHDIGQDLVALARDCLVKDPAERLGLVPWDRLREVAQARPTISKPTVDLAALMRDASERYAETVEAKQEEVRRRETQRSETLARGVDCVKRALDMPIVAEVGGSVSVVRGRAHVVMLALPENVKMRFPRPLWVCARVRMDEGALESIRAEGLGFYGDVPSMRRPHPASYSAKPEELERQMLAQLGPANDKFDRAAVRSASA